MDQGVSASTASTSGRNPGRASEYASWDYLKAPAGTPSSAQHYYDPLEKKTFKPGWERIKPYAVIKPDEPRLQAMATKASGQQSAQQLRSERLQDKNTYNKFNPITGQALQSDGTWAGASNPWQHQKPTTKLVPQDTSAAQVSNNRQAHNAAAYSMRKERIHNDGLTTSKRTGGTVADAMRWSG